MVFTSHIPQLVEAQQKEVIKQELSNRWQEEHADFVKAHNQTVAQEGFPLSE